LIRERAEEIKVRSSIEISPDPKEEPFCHCSEQGKGDFVITLIPDDFPQEHLRASLSHRGIFSRERRSVRPNVLTESEYAIFSCAQVFC
jgi:hypothetical protein